MCCITQSEIYRRGNVDYAWKSLMTMKRENWELANIIIKDFFYIGKCNFIILENATSNNNGHHWHLQVYPIRNLSKGQRRLCVEIVGNNEARKLKVCYHRLSKNFFILENATSNNNGHHWHLQVYPTWSWKS